MADRGCPLAWYAGGMACWFRIPRGAGMKMDRLLAVGESGYCIGPPGCLVLPGSGSRLAGIAKREEHTRRSVSIQKCLILF